MGDEINLAFVHDSLPIFGIGSSLNRWMHELATIGTNALCWRTRQEQVIDFVPKVSCTKIFARENFCCCIVCCLISLREIDPPRRTKNRFNQLVWFSTLYTVMYRWMFHLGANLMLSNIVSDLGHTSIFAEGNFSNVLHC